jgi:two-component system NarL family response regulator
MSGDAFIDALRGFEQGVPPFSPGLASRLLTEFSRLSRGNEPIKHEPPESETDPNGLTQRQTEVLRLVADGLTYKEVGERLSLSERTVRFHMAEIINRLHLQNRSQVLAYVGKHGLKPPD